MLHRRCEDLHTHLQYWQPLKYITLRDNDITVDKAMHFWSCYIWTEDLYSFSEGYIYEYSQQGMWPTVHRIPATRAESTGEARCGSNQ
jgi:hypothetical protein